MDKEDAKMKKRRTESVNFNDVTTYSSTPSPFTNNTSESTLIESPNASSNITIRNWLMGDRYQVWCLIKNNFFISFSMLIGGESSWSWFLWGCSRRP